MQDLWRQYEPSFQIYYPGRYEKRRPGVYFEARTRGCAAGLHRVLCKTRRRNRNVSPPQLGRTWFRAWKPTPIQSLNTSLRKRG